MSVYAFIHIDIKKEPIITKKKKNSTDFIGSFMTCAEKHSYIG